MTESALSPGDVALVTGSTDGIGREIARGLAETGATVLLHGRDRAKGERVVRDLASDTGNDRVELATADFTDLDAVRDLAATVRDDHGRLDVLVENAGTWQGERRLVDVPGSGDGIEMTFVVNHLAHYLLTRLLVDTLAAAGEARVVTVSSDLHRRARLDLDAVEGPTGPSGIDAYARSKLANALFTLALARRLPDGVTANACHPGIVPSTAIDRDGWLPRRLGWSALRLVGPLVGLTSSPGDAARTPLYLARSPDVATTTGAYFSDGRRVDPSSEALDRDAQRRLWAASAEWVGLSEEEIGE